MSTVSELARPERCLLCGWPALLDQAGFRQIYGQPGSAPIYLRWWECRLCRGWFVFPVPTPEEISRHCSVAVWNDQDRKIEIAHNKGPLQNRIFAVLGKWTRFGALLDFGCSFGEFMELARKVGWAPSGFDPNEVSAKVASTRGFEVRSEWQLHRAVFPENHFAAITAIDSFYYTWDPYETLQLFFRLLQPGGVLAMRLTNKRVVLGLARALSRSGAERDKRLSRILQGQFHSIAIESLVSILRSVGFDRIEVDSQAMTASWRTLSASTRLAYGLARVVSLLTLYKVNLSPGVLLFAQKAP